MEISGILGFLILIADIYAVLQIAQSSSSNGKKALWIAIVIVLPVLGLIAWYLMGPGRPG
ncbi:MAG: PLDc_N domain-containing protein [Proteobacteria bacterium]|nr:PLDc_N domain-containing protein [Pseudomonadota bacterium]